MPTIPAPPSASDRGFPSPPAWPGEVHASGRNRRGSGRSSGTARSRLRLSPRLAQLLQTGPPATDDGWRVMIPEMLQGFFLKIVFHRELADLTFQFADPAGVVYGGQTRTASSDSGKRQIPLGAPFASPTIQQMGAYLILARDLTGGRAGIERLHRRDLQIATVNSSGQIHSSLHSMYLFP